MESILFPLVVAHLGEDLIKQLSKDILMIYLMNIPLWRVILDGHHLKMEGAQVHRLSILNSLMVISFLVDILLVIFFKTVRHDLTRYEELDKESQMNEGLSRCSELLCIIVGDGIHILGMVIVIILFLIPIYVRNEMKHRDMIEIKRCIKLTFYYLIKTVKL